MKWPSYSDFEAIGAPYMPPTQPEPTPPVYDFDRCTCVRLDVDHYDVRGCYQHDTSLPDAPSPTGEDSQESSPIFPEQELIAELKRLDMETRSLAMETALVADRLTRLIERYTR